MTGLGCVFFPTLENKRHYTPVVQAEKYSAEVKSGAFYSKVYGLSGCSQGAAELSVLPDVNTS